MTVCVSSWPNGILSRVIPDNCGSLRAFPSSFLSLADGSIAQKSPRAVGRVLGVRGFTRAVHRRSHVLAKILDTDAADLKAINAVGERQIGKSPICARNESPPIRLNSVDQRSERFLMQNVARYPPFQSTNVFAVPLPECICASQSLVRRRCCVSLPDAETTIGRVHSQLPHRRNRR